MQDGQASPSHTADSGGTTQPLSDDTGNNDAIGAGGDYPARAVGSDPAQAVATPAHIPSSAGPSIPAPSADAPESGADGAGAHSPRGRNKRVHEAESAEDVAGGNSGELRARPRPRAASRTASPQGDELGDLMSDTDKYLKVFQHLFNTIKAGTGGGDVVDDSSSESGGKQGGKLPSSEAQAGSSTPSTWPTDPPAYSADGASQAAADMRRTAPEPQSSSATETTQPQAHQMRAQQAVPMTIAMPGATPASAPVRPPTRSSVDSGRRMSVTELATRLSQWECGACHKSNPTTAMHECMYCHAPGPADDARRRDQGNDPNYNLLRQLQPMEEDTAEDTKTASPAPTWMCSACNAMNYRIASKCHLCEVPRGFQLCHNVLKESEAAAPIDATSSPSTSGNRCTACGTRTNLANEDGCPWCRSSSPDTPLEASEGEDGNERPSGASGQDDGLSSMASNVASTSTVPPPVVGASNTATNVASTSTAPIDPVTPETGRCKVCHIKTALTTENGCHWCDRAVEEPSTSNPTPSSPVRSPVRPRAPDLPAAPPTSVPTGVPSRASFPLTFTGRGNQKRWVCPSPPPRSLINHRPRWTCQFCATETVVSETNCNWCNVPRFTVPFDEEDPADNDDTDIIVLLRSELDALPPAVACELEHDPWVKARSEMATVPGGCVRVRASRFFDAIEQVEREVEHEAQELQAQEAQQAVQAEQAHGTQDVLGQGTQEEQDAEDTQDAHTITFGRYGLTRDDTATLVMATPQSDRTIDDQAAIGAPRVAVTVIPTPWKCTNCRDGNLDNNDCEVCKHPPVCYEPEHGESLQSPDTEASVMSVQDSQVVESESTECSWKCYMCNFDNVDNATGMCEGCNNPPPSGENEAAGPHSPSTDADAEDVQDTQPVDYTPPECSHCSVSNDTGADLCDRCRTLHLFTYGNCGRTAALQPQPPAPNPRVRPGASFRQTVASNSSDPDADEEHNREQHERTRDINQASGHTRRSSTPPAEAIVNAFVGDKGKGRAADPQDSDHGAGRRCEITVFQAEVLALFEKEKLWTEGDLELVLGSPLHRVHGACYRLAQHGAIKSEGEGIWRHVPGHSLANRPLDPARLVHNHNELVTAERELDTLRLRELGRNVDELRDDLKTQATSFSSHYTVTNAAQDDLSDRLTATNLSLEGLSDAFKEVRNQFRAMRDVAVAREKNRTNHWLGRPLVPVPRPDGILPVHLATLSCYDDLASLTRGELEEWLQFYADDPDLSIGEGQQSNALLALAGYLGLESAVSPKLALTTAVPSSSAAATIVEDTPDNTPASPTEPKAMGRTESSTESDRSSFICTETTPIQVPAVPTATPTNRPSFPNTAYSYRSYSDLQLTDANPVFQDAWCTIYRGAYRAVPATEAVESPPSHSGSDTASTTKSPESTPWTLLEGDGTDLTDMRFRRESTESTLMGDVPMVSFSRPPSAGPGPSSSEAAARRAAQAWLRYGPFGRRPVSTDAADTAAQVAADEAFALALSESYAMADPAAVQIKQDEDIARALADEEGQDPWSWIDTEWEPRATAAPNVQQPSDEDLDIQRALLDENEQWHRSNWRE